MSVNYMIMDPNKRQSNEQDSKIRKSKNNAIAASPMDGMRLRMASCDTREEGIAAAGECCRSKDKR